MYSLASRLRFIRDESVCRDNNPKLDLTPPDFIANTSHEWTLQAIKALISISSWGIKYKEIIFTMGLYGQKCPSIESSFLMKSAGGLVAHMG